MKTFNGVEIISLKNMISIDAYFGRIVFHLHCSDCSNRRPVECSFCVSSRRMLE